MQLCDNENSDAVQLHADISRQKTKLDKLVERLRKSVPEADSPDTLEGPDTPPAEAAEERDQPA